MLNSPTHSPLPSDLMNRPLPEQGLPGSLRLLCISPEEPSWIGLTLQLDAEGCHEPRFRWVSCPSQAVAVLRDESFDCILLADEGRRAGDYDSVALLRAMRASGCNDPVVLLIPRLDDEFCAEVCHQDAELLVSPKLWDSKALLPVIKRAMCRLELIHENHRLASADHRRLARERDEAEQLLRQQRQIIQELQAASLSWPEAGDPDSRTPDPTDPQIFHAAASVLPESIKDYYHELLRTYVIIGSGSLSGEIMRLAEIFAVAGLSPRGALALHLERVESLVRGLGNRSARHVMARADLLALELMVHLGEAYQNQSQVRAPGEGFALPVR